jgi:hypothetical protein
LFSKNHKKIVASLGAEDFAQPSEEFLEAFEKLQVLILLFLVARPFCFKYVLLHPRLQLSVIIERRNAGLS